MATFVETFDTFKAEMDNLGIDYDEALFEKVTRGLGPSIYSSDSSRVSCSDQSELDTVKNNFLVKKLGLEDAPELNEALKEVCEQMGTSNRNKFRACFYYLLVKKFGKEDIYE